MKKLIRGWILKLKRRRIHREMRAQGNYGALERSIRAEGNVCSNCNVTLTGPFCHICGQKDDDLDRPIWTLLREILDDTFSTDSRLLKTLFLLVLVPGGLTRAFRMGRRARFVPPLRLYFVVSIMFFLMISVADILILDIHVTPKATEEEATEALPEAQPQTSLDAAERPENTDDSDAGASQGGTAPEDKVASPPAVEAPVSDADVIAQYEAAREIVRARDEGFAYISDFEDLPQDLQDDFRALVESGELARMVREAEETPGLIEAAVAAAPAETRVDDAAKPQEAESGQAAGETPAEEIPAEQSVEDRVRAMIGDARFEALPETTKEQIRNAVPGEKLSIDGDDVAGALLAAEFDDVAEDSSSGFNLSIPYDFDAKMFVKNSGEEREGFKQEDIDKVLNDPEYPVALKRATESFANALKDPQEFNELFNDWLPRALFVLMPFFALLLRVFHWRRDQRYLQQIVFSLHFHTFLFLLLGGLMIIVPRFGGEMGFGIFWWGTSLYLIIALKVGQGQGWIKAFLKAGFIWVGYYIVMTLTMLAVVFVGLGDIDLIDLMRGNTADFEVGAEAPATDGQEPPASSDT